jgi:hypothetical protein
MSLCFWARHRPTGLRLRNTAQAPPPLSPTRPPRRHPCSDRQPLCRIRAPAGRHAPMLKRAASTGPSSPSSRGHHNQTPPLSNFPLFSLGTKSPSAPSLFPSCFRPRRPTVRPIGPYRPGDPILNLSTSELRRHCRILGCHHRIFSFMTSAAGTTPPVESSHLSLFPPPPPGAA